MYSDEEYGGIADEEFGWKSYVKSISIKEGPKQYGYYRKKGKTFFRNYHRELKNGKGLSIVDILQWKIKQAEKQMLKVLNKAMDWCPS